MAAYLADKVLVFEGKPSVDCTANAPESLASGMNRFLSVSSIYIYIISLPSLRLRVLYVFEDEIIK
jgi:hypothetical protein